MTFSGHDDSTINTVLGLLLLLLYPTVGHPPMMSLHCALAAAQCTVIGPVCGFVAVFVCLFVCLLWVYYHDNSKLRASIPTKLGL